MEPAIAIDEAGRVHIVHLRLHDFTVPPVNEIRYVEQTPSGWQSEAFDGLTFGAPSLSVREGTIHVTYGRFLTSGEVPANILRLAVREGGRWTIQDLDQGDASALVVDAEGGLHVVYRDHLVEELRYAWNTGAGWQSMVLATGTTLFGEPLKNDKISMSFFAPAMALDPEGRVQLCFGIGISNGESGTHVPLAATLEDGVWWPRAVGPSKFTLNTLAISSSGIVHAIGTRPTQGTTAVTTLSQKGRKLTLSVVPKEAGVITDTVTGAECTSKLVQSYAAGAEVTLTATPAPGYAFIGWTGAASGTEPSCTVTLEKSRKVVARFEALPP